MKKNIVIVGFLGELNDQVCKKLSEDLNMFYANVPDMIAYELTSADEMITVCGLEYYQEQEDKVLRRLSTFENTMFCFDYQLFFDYAQKYFLNSCHIIYLKTSEKQLENQIKNNNDVETWSNAIDVIDFVERNKNLEKLSDIAIDCERPSVQAYCKKIKEYLKNFFE